MKYSVSLAAILLAMPALAQTNPIIPNIEPGRIQDRFDDRVRPPVSTDSIIDSIQVPGSGPQLAPGITFTLNDINIVGNEAVDAADLRHLYADKLGTKVSLEDVQGIVNAITAYYRNEGYILSRAVLPPQRIGDGAVTIQIVEGKIDQIEFQGEPVDNGVLKKYADKIRASMPLNVQDLERYLLLMEDLPGITARGTLRPAANVSGASDLVITLSRKKIEGVASVNNRGSRFLGPLQGDLGIQGNSLFGLNERVSLRTVQTLNLDELSYIEGSWTQPVGGDGLSLRLLGSMTDTEPGASLRALDIEGDSHTIYAEASYPYIRSRRENLYFNAALTYRNSESDTLGVNVFDDRIRHISADVAYDFIDMFEGISQFNVGITQGLSILDANDDGDLISRTGADASFTKFTAQASRLQSLNNQFALQVSAAGQYADEELFASEEFAVGGAAFGSAFDPAEISGDSGLAGRLELQYNGLYANDWLDNYQVYGFYDIARVWNENALAGEEDRASLSSAGLGVRFNLLRQWRGYVEYAAPLTRDVAAEGSDGDDNRVFFSVSYILP